MLRPRELYESPANIFVATFIGSPSMNLYQASLDTGSDPAAIVLGSQRLSLPATVLKRNLALAPYQGREVIVGIRPEHLTDPGVAGTAPEPGASLTVSVDYVEMLGSEQLVHFTIDAPRDQAVFNVDVERMHFFDLDTGDAISPAVPA